MKNNYAYISDSGTGVTPLHAGLVIYDFQVRDPSLSLIFIISTFSFIVVQLQNNTSRRVLNQVNSTQPDPSTWVTINGERVFPTTPIQTGAGIRIKYQMDIWEE